jgi:sugar lactone lactonase YvrE
VNKSGDLFIADVRNHRVRKVSPGGVITTMAGNGTGGFSGDGGPATSAQLNNPWGVAADLAGNLFIADTGNERIRKVTPTGIISTVAGSGMEGFSGDGGPAISAQLYGPTGIAVDTAGNLFISDQANQRIRKVTAAGIIGTVAGNGTYGFSGDGGPATSAQLFDPEDVAIDSTGNLFIADTNDHCIRKVTPGGVISTVAGSGIEGFSGDGGPAASAQLDQTVGIAVDTDGGLLIADLGNQRIRKVTPAGIISTVAGNGGPGFSGDGGLATSAQLHFPTGVTVDATGNLLIADSSNTRIRKVTPAGVISTAAGGDSTPLNSPTGIAVDATGDLFIAETWGHRVSKVTPGGVFSAVAGNGGTGSSGDGGPATSAQLDFPSGVAVDTEGNLFIAESDASRIRKVTRDGLISTAAGTGVAGFSGDGGSAKSARLNMPYGVAVDAGGNLYIADRLNHRVRKVTPAGVINTVAGNGIAGFSGDGGAAVSAQLFGPSGVTVDEAGNLFIADSDNNRIRKVTPGGGDQHRGGNWRRGIQR